MRSDEAVGGRVGHGAEGRRRRTWVWSVILLLLSRPSRCEFSVELLEGSAQMRNFTLAGHRDAHWLRVLPPRQPSQGASETCFMVVRVPDSWSPPDRISSAAEVAQANARPLATLEAVLRDQGLLQDGDALVEAVRVVSLVRPVLAGDRCRDVAPRYAEIWPLWRVLEEADCADSLSAAFSALQLLRGHGVEARLARYPGASGAAVFGVLLSQAAPTLGAPWAYRVGAAEILPVHPSLAPAVFLEAGDIVSWSWPEILASGWSPAVAAARAPDLLGPGAGPRPAPDLCRQRRALGLSCEEPGPRRGLMLNAISTSILLVLLALAVRFFRRRRQRLARVEKLRAEAQGRTF